MLQHRYSFVLSVLLASCSYSVYARTDVASQFTAVQPDEAAPHSLQAPTPCTDCFTIPALTPVRIEILATLSSKISKTADTFPIRLAQPIHIGERDVVPAGATGLGEVIHAKKSGGSGAAGELVLAARYIEVNGQHLRLRSLRLAMKGHSKVGTVDAINVGSAASLLPIGLIGLFITGGQATVPQGMIADAKTAEAFTIDQSSPAPRHAS